MNHSKSSPPGGSGLRIGLCCIFRDEPIRFRQTTAKALQKIPRPEQLGKLSEICLFNAKSLRDALHFVINHGIGAFRILSPLFPRYTHPQVGYKMKELPDAEEISQQLNEIKKLREQKGIRLSFHPDQFNVLSSPKRQVIEKTILELEYHGMLAERVGAEVINIHPGGRYDSKKEALARFKRNFFQLSGRVRSRLALENDDRSFAPADILPTCEALSIPLVYDVHHHRCLPDGMSEERVTREAAALWQGLGREPYFHISSPKNGWQGGNPRPHADYIDPQDFPHCWRPMDVTIDVEAKAKELAVLRLRQDLGI